MEHDPSNRRFETADLRLSTENIERAADAILNNPETVSFLTAKIQNKLDFKARISTDDGTNTPDDWKRLGGLIVHTECFPENIATILRANGVDIYEDEAVLELHVPPQDASIGDFPNSMKRLYEYLSANRNSEGAPIYIYGISYLLKSLSGFIKKYGFQTVDLPDDIKNQTGAARVLDMYLHSENEKRKKMAERFRNEDIQLCYVSVDDFLDSFEK